MRTVIVAMIAWLSISGATSAQPAPANGEGTVFHKGDRVLVTPSGGEWWYCTLISDRVGNPPDNFSYSAICDPWPRTANEKPAKQTHLFSAERVKALTDPDALAGVARMQATFPMANGGADPQGPPAQGAAPAGLPPPVMPPPLVMPPAPGQP